MRRGYIMTLTDDTKPRIWARQGHVYYVVLFYTRGKFKTNEFVLKKLI